MRVALLILAGCASAPAPITPVAITALSHGFVEAYDRGDRHALDAALHPEYLHFEGGTPLDRAGELAELAKRGPATPHMAKRAWSREQVFAHADRAVFIGQAHEQMGGNDTHGGYQYDGWYTLTWLRDGDAWRLAMWTWQRAGEAVQRDSWNDIFRTSLGFNHEPNRLLVDTLRDVAPGRALDVAMGQGRNALWLAAHGWKVTGVDFSEEGLRLARAAADDKHLSIETVNANLDTYDFGVDKWDLVTVIYAGAAKLEKILPSLRRGGLVVIEYFHKEPDEPDGFATGHLKTLFGDGFEILRDDVVEDVPDWARDRAVLVRFVARKR